MKTIIGVKFKKTNKVYYFHPNGVQAEVGEGVIVETARGPEYGQVVMEQTQVEDDKVVTPLKNVIRKATDRDYRQMEKNKTLEQEAFSVFEQKIAEHNLVMKAISVEYAFDASKITFFFTADGRVDFRELVKSLAQHFRTRIELRQIGVRDEAKMLGGLGKCGCPVCCKRFLSEFTPVSIKMAKEQNISLNPGKISGLCGRLMCCLNYEQEYYEEMNKKMPRPNSEVTTPEGKGTVVENNVITGMVKVKLVKPDETVEIRDYPYQELKFDKKNPKKNAKDKKAQPEKKREEPKGDPAQKEQ